jgi:hypothetical protein
MGHLLSPQPQALTGNRHHQDGKSGGHFLVSPHWLETLRGDSRTILNGTIKEALAASAEAFTDLQDRFELVDGNDSIKLIP